MYCRHAYRLICNYSDSRKIREEQTALSTVKKSEIFLVCLVKTLVNIKVFIIRCLYCRIGLKGLVALDELSCLGNA